MDWVYILGFFGVCVAIGLGLVGIMNSVDARKKRAIDSGQLRRTIRLRPEGEPFPDCEHAVVSVESPAAYCEWCGRPMEDRVARLRGFSRDTGLPEYAIVRACPRANLCELFGVLWQTNLRRHTVQGPTETRIIVIAVLLLLAGVLLAVAVPALLPKPAPTVVRIPW